MARGLPCHKMEVLPRNSGGRGTSYPLRQASFSWYKAKDPEEKPGQMDGKSMRSSRLATS